MALSVLVLLLALFAAACGPTPDPPPPASPAAQDMVARHNYVRGLNGLGALSVDANMQTNAQFHADRLATGATNCATLWHSSELGAWYPGYASGENVACVSGCPDDAQRTFDLWLNSPGHAANVYNGGFGWIGVGVSCNGSVQMVVAHYRSP